MLCKHLRVTPINSANFELEMSKSSVGQVSPERKDLFSLLMLSCSQMLRQVISPLCVSPSPLYKQQE